MVARPTGDTWRAEPHTLAKIDVLKTYLVAYFQILGRTSNAQDLLYIDGFAGPNKYQDGTLGSPGAALVAATAAISMTSTAWVAGRIHFAFVESKAARFKILQESLQPWRSRTDIQLHTFNAEFVKALPLIKQAVPGPFASDSPLFAFIDPFGATGVPFESIANILNSPCSEVLINLDADGVSRIFKAKQSANHAEILTQIFGDTSWDNSLTDDQSFDTQCRIILNLYKERLRTIPGVRYVFEMEMQNKSHALNYFLVFASKHPLGLRKMKEAMKSIEQNGTYTFSDANVGQTALFRFDEPELYYLELFNHFHGQNLTYDGLTDEVTEYALNRTPFVDAKSMLRHLERHNYITANSSDPKRKRGTFNDSVSSIDFHGKVQHGLF